jgi:hypothetical protein
MWLHIIVTKLDWQSWFVCGAHEHSENLVPDAIFRRLHISSIYLLFNRENLTPRAQIIVAAISAPLCWGLQVQIGNVYHIFIHIWKKEKEKLYCYLKIHRKFWYGLMNSAIIFEGERI